MRSTIYFALLILIPITLSPAFSQNDPRIIEVVQKQEQEEAQLSSYPQGDRIQSSNYTNLAYFDDVMRSSTKLSPDYIIESGDTLTIRVRGKVDLNYGAESSQSSTANENLNLYKVMPDGKVHLPLIGPVEAAGKTVGEFKKHITKDLSRYFKHFNVDVGVSSPGNIKVWISGQVKNPGPMSLTSSSTVLEAFLRAGVLTNGSTRLVKLTRANGDVHIIDVYSIVTQGNLESNLTLSAGDQLYIPSGTNWVTVNGEVFRPGTYEMVPLDNNSSKKFYFNDLMALCQGLSPTAAGSNIIIERKTDNGSIEALHVDFTANENPELKPGDKIDVPSILDCQPTIRLVGEFKGEGVYQRVSGTVLNKSGVLSFIKGQTAGDVIIRTGGTTPQADFKRAKIERRKDGKIEVIPLDLERLITKQDKTADIELESGDTIILPALLDKVYVLGQVVKPGGIAYEPDRRLLEYLASAGGPNTKGKSTAIVVRGGDSPEVIKVDTIQGMKGQEKHNPIMEPGDVIYVPGQAITDWRDMAQIISTVRVLTLMF